MAPLAARPQDLEQLRRSIAMLSPGTMALPREDALALFAEVQHLQGSLDRLADGLRALLDGVTSEQPPRP